MQAELSHRPEEASAIVTSSFQKVQVGSKSGLVESLSLKQLGPSHHGPFPSPLSASPSWAGEQRSTVWRGRAEILDLGTPGSCEGRGHSTNRVSVEPTCWHRSRAPAHCGGAIQSGVSEAALQPTPLAWEWTPALGSRRSGCPLSCASSQLYDFFYLVFLNVCLKLCVRRIFVL